MNLRTLFVWSTVLVLAMFIACEEPAGPSPGVPGEAEVSGRVLQQDNTPILDATVLLTSALGSQSTTSDTAGRYSFTVVFDTVRAAISARLLVTKVGFTRDSTSLVLAAGNRITNLNFILRPDTGVVITPGPGASGPASNIVFISSSSDHVNVKGTGAPETATLTFEVRDANGIPVDSLNRATVQFSITVGPGGGEFLSPASAVTDILTGRVRVTLNSGTRSGIVQIQAQTTVGGNTIRSTPTPFPIYGGLPDPSHFSISAEKPNFEGLGRIGPTNNVGVQLGDQYSNPVQPTTAIYFNTRGGTIDAVAYTDQTGRASAVLRAGNPQPNDQIYGPGFSWVVGQTVGAGGTVIKDSVLVLFSGRAQVTGPAAGFTLPDGSSLTFNYIVSDENLNPLVDGTSIKVSASGPAAKDVEVLGDIDRTVSTMVLPADADTTRKRTFTNYSFTVTDPVPNDTLPSRALALTIDVSGPNGTTKYSFTGVLEGASPIGGSGDAANIVLAGLSSSSISVRGAGGVTESATLAFEARDATGRPVDSDHSVTVNFLIQAGPGGGELIFPTSAITDLNGRASTTLNSGTRSGNVQVVARATVGVTTLQSEPVVVQINGGLPDQDHIFSRWIDATDRPLLSRFLNIPANKPDQGIEVQVGDKYANPVIPGTVVYLTSSLGIVTPQVVTDQLGVGRGIFSVAGETRLGAGRLISSTFGEGGVFVLDTLDFLVSGLPVIQVAGNPNNFLVSDGGRSTFNYTVSDAAGSPLSENTNITVTVGGTASSLVALDGDVLITLPNTVDAAKWTNFSFQIYDPDPTFTTFSGTLVVTISVEGSNGSERFSFSGGFQGTGGPPPGGSGEAASFRLVALNPTEISVQGVGGVETAAIVFEARDNQGRPIDSDNAVEVRFNILLGPNGGEFITPSIDTTDAAGRVFATINSGTVSGPMMIQAVADVSTGSIRSTPVQIAIASGLPDQAHFSVATQLLNFWGWDFINNRMSATVIVGDKYSNPVKAGTVVSFRTDGNVVAGDNLADVTGGSSLTDGAGVAIATIISANPRPSDPILGPGYGYLRAQTIGVDPITNNTVTVQGSALYVTSSDIAFLSVVFIDSLGAQVPPQGFRIRGSGSGTFIITVEDVNGNPIVGGSTVSISTSYSPPEGSDIKIVIDPASIKIRDALFPGSGTTDHTFRVVDATAGGITAPQQFPVTVKVTHARTGTEFIFSFSGTAGG